MTESNRSEKLSTYGIITAITLGLYLSSLHSYLLFHSLIEITTIAVAFTLLILTLNTRKYLANSCLRLLGIGYAFIALIDLLHTLAYKGMNVFPGYGANLPTQLWIAARYLQAVTLFAAPLLVARKTDNRVISGGYTAVVALLVSMVYSGNFPDCFIEGKGLTTFKIGSEYVISAILLVSLYLFYEKREYFNDKIFSLIISSIACTVLSEISFTAYVNVYGFANMVGHFAKLAAFYFIYRALLVTGLREPFELIFRDLKQAEEALQKSNDTLEEKVTARTAELSASEARYRSLIQKVQAAIIIHDAQGCIIGSNSLAQELLGLSGELLLGRTVDDPDWHFLREDGSVMPASEYPVSVVLATGQPLRNRVVGICCPDREYVSWVLVNAEPEYEDTGKIARVIVSFVDITERKKAEEASRKAGAYTRSLIEASLDPLVTIGPDGRITDVNAATETVTGYSRVELIGADFSDYFTEPEKARAGYRQVFEEGLVRDYPLEIRHREGQVTTVLYNASVYRDEAGQVLGVFASARDITERQRAEVKERLLSAIVESSDDAIIAKTLDGDILSWNRGAESVYGYSAAETIGRSVSILFPADHPDELTEIMTHIAQGERIEHYTTEMVRKDGKRITISLTISPIRDGAGTIVGASSIAHDVTERQRAEQALKLSEDRLRTAQRLARIGSWELDLVTNNLIWSDEIYRIFEINPEKFGASYEAFLEVIHPDDRATVNAAYTDSVRSRNPYAIGHRLRFPDGRIKYVIEQCENFYAADGRPLRSIGTVQDITELKQAEEKLRSSEASLRTLVQTIPDLIWLKDAAGIYLTCNRMFERFFGASEADIIGKTDYDFVDRELADFFREHDRKAMDAGKPISNEEWITFADDGRHALLETIKTPMCDADGNLIGVLGIGHDITEHRSLENQLRQAQKLEAIGTLTGGVAHDFNNILSVIIGFGSMLEMKMATDDPLHDNVTQILIAADRAAKLTRSMLAFSRKQAMEVKAENMNEIISGMEKMIRRLIRENIELRISLTEEALPVLADAGQLEQVLLNLTTNAKDSMPTGGIITITTGKAELDESFRKAHGYGEPGSYALISFIDSGEGMDTDVRQRIFEPFFTTKVVGKGTGLGLAVCYGIIKQHQGYIVCYSEPGKGTTFRIYLPLNRLATAAEAAAAVESLPPQGGTETILVAEDDAAVRSLTINILKEFGYAIIEAEDGAEAVAQFAGHGKEIQLCLFDMIMPKRNGLSAYEEIKKVRPDVKVLFMSGYQPDAACAGVNLISKPVLPLELLKRVRELLDQSS